MYPCMCCLFLPDMPDYIFSSEQAAELDRGDALAGFRNRFHIPHLAGRTCIYLTGNSLGLQPKAARAAVEQEFIDWQNLGVEGHIEAKFPWLYYHHFMVDDAAYVVGAKKDEVVVMNSLTVNLHLLMVSFYRPTTARYKIIMEGGAFPSDQYAVESQVKFHGFNPEDAIIELLPRAGEHCLRTEDILATISQHAHSLALVMLGGVNYYTGQAFDMEKITYAAHEAGALCGFDLAHAAGNLVLKLHDWEVDFACWCGYKYLNSGPGGSSGIFVHEQHGNNPDLPRFAGWWGHDEKERFKMRKGFKPMSGAAGWQLSNAQVLPMAVHRVSLQLFREAGLENLRSKSEMLTPWLEFILKETAQRNPALAFEIITPPHTADRGCQLSVLCKKNGRALFEHLKNHGVVADWREPDVIRMAPVPLYNTFTEMWELGEIMMGFKG